MESIVDVVLGGTHTEEQLKEFEGKLSEDGKKLFTEARAFVTKRQDEETKLNRTAEERAVAERELEAKRAELLEIEGKLGTAKTEHENTQNANSQFRAEQVSKAKEKFFADYSIPAEQHAQYEEEFKKLDSGKVDPELIGKDWVRTYAALNADSLLDAKKRQDQMAENAARDAQGGAGSHDNAPPGNGPSKFSDAAQSIAKQSGIPLETAERINKDGFSRTIG